MPNLTSGYVHFRTVDNDAFATVDLIDCIFDSEFPGVSIALLDEFDCNFHPLTKLNLPFYGGHGSHAGDYAASVVAYDGEDFWEHPCDEEGNIAIPDMLATPTSHPDYQLSLDAIAFIQHHARVLNLVHTDPSKILPKDFILSPADDEAKTVRLDVPESLILHARKFYSVQGSIVIAEYYRGEDYLICLDDIFAEREALIADAWPPHFLDVLEKLAAEDVDYVRISCG